MKKIRYIRLFSVLLILSAIGGYYFSSLGLPLTPKVLIRNYPALENPKEITLTCDYHGDKLNISETLYGSVDEYYRTEPKKFLSYYKNDNKSFVFNYQEDKTLDEIVQKIDSIAVSKGLNSDQKLDLAACFMQSIPYDQAKAEKILSDTEKFSVEETIPRYPYETLYDFQGICTDKSYLGSAILTRLGYENALLSFDTQRHLSLGVAVPAGYGQLGTDYGILELTSQGFLVGDIPQIKNNIGLAENTINNLPEINLENQPTDKKESSTLTNSNRIEKVSDGSRYIRIVERFATKQAIDTMTSQIEEKLASVKAGQIELQSAENELQQAESAYKRIRTEAAYNDYLTVYNNYQAIYKKTNSVITSYNYDIKKYNQLVEQYKSF